MPNRLGGFSRAIPIEPSLRMFSGALPIQPSNENQLSRAMFMEPLGVGVPETEQGVNPEITEFLKLLTSVASFDQKITLREFIRRITDGGATNDPLVLLRAIEEARNRGIEPKTSSEQLGRDRRDEEDRKYIQGLRKKYPEHFPQPVFRNR